MPDPATPMTVLVLQGGGALGSYQAGVYEALLAGGEAPDWVGGISIGAINAALIAGNPPERRVERLRQFWTKASAGPQAAASLTRGPARQAINTANASLVALLGVSGFFRPRLPWPQLFPPGAPQALSYYDTAPLRDTLLELVDFDLINTGQTRLSVGAVNVRTGNFAYFDSRRERIGPEHIMASGALPPGFPPVEIDGEFYWDGGLVSNTPLQYVLDEDTDEDLLIFQVDLFSARGPMPRTLAEAAEREMDIRYSSRTRHNTDANLTLHRTKQALRDLIKSLPEAMLDDEGVKLLNAAAKENAVTVVQLIRRPGDFEGAAKDYEFSRATMLDHWAAGVRAVRRSMRRRDAMIEPPPSGGTRVIDVKPADGADPA